MRERGRECVWGGGRGEERGKERGMVGGSGGEEGGAGSRAGGGGFTNFVHSRRPSHPYIAGTTPAPIIWGHSACLEL